MEAAAKGTASTVAKSSRLARTFKSDIKLLKREFILFFTLTSFFYGLGTKFSQLGVHFFHPDPSKWTDAELGIPPDNED